MCGVLCWPVVVRVVIKSGVINTLVTSVPGRGSISPEEAGRGQAGRGRNNIVLKSEKS